MAQSSAPKIENTAQATEATEEENPSEELQQPPQGQENPFLNPELDELVEKRINEDIWEQLKGELPCIQATTECLEELEASALQNSRLLQEVDERIAEAQDRIEEAKTKNLQSVSISTFSPFLQSFIGETFTPYKGVDNPLKGILGNLLGGLAGQFLSILFPWQNQATSEGATNRAIAIGDLQIKVAELQRARAEIADKLREKVLLEGLQLEQTAREFQIQQEIAKRDKARIEIIKISYQFGEGNSESYLNQLSNYDRQKAQTWREWAKLRSQLTKVKILVLGSKNER